MDRAELKARARAQLGGGIFQNLWMMGLAVCLLIGLMESAAAGILPGIGALIVVGPLEYGMAFIFLKQARDHQPVQLGDMFRGFQDDFGGTFLIGLMTSLFTFLWSLLFVIPGIVKMASSSFGITEPEGDGILQHLIEGKDYTLYGLANAVTRYSQDVESYDRASKLEEIGYNVLTMSPDLFRAINKVTRMAA